MHGSIFLFNEVNRCKNLTFCENFGSLFCLLTTKRKAGTMLCCQTVASWGTVVVRDRLAAFDSFRHYMVWCCFHLVCLCVCVCLIMAKCGFESKSFLCHVLICPSICGFLSAWQLHDPARCRHRCSQVCRRWKLCLKLSTTCWCRCNSSDRIAS